jgi:CRISPR/Cas system endoribonuclease Cas6 (RAMP superfamily)
MNDTFTIHHLRFTAQVETTIELGAFKGSALRGAWQSHLRTLYCAQRNTGNDPLHQAMCPVCFLLSRETGSGDDRRPYAFVPPLTRQATFEPGERFTFGISLFGQTVQFLPYLVLAVGQMGQAQGLGKRIHPPADGQGAGDVRRRGKRPQPRRGTFRLASIEEVNPLNGEQRTLLEEGGSMVQMPALAVSSQQIAVSSEGLAQQLEANGRRLTLDFLTPTRIVHQERLVHQPHFSPLFARLLDRVSALRSQFAEGTPLSQEDKAHLLSLADQVQLIVDETQWWDVKGRSTRLGRPQPLGGFVGRALYQAESLDVWRPLLPWLLWGQSTQVGKNVVKGCGWYRIANGEWANGE